VKARTIFKWAIGVIAIVVLIGVGAVVWLFVAVFMSLEKGEKHPIQLHAEQDSGKGAEPGRIALLRFRKRKSLLNHFILAQD
jgi:hypothetical protein